MKAEKIIVGVLYVAAGALLANGLWLFPQSPDRQFGGVILMIFGVLALVLAMHEHGKDGR